MATYCIGDIHACYSEFCALLEKIRFDEAADTLYLTGDLVGRGPYPVETVRLIMSLKSSAKAVLGNHDLHLLAAASGIITPRKRDNLDVLLSAPDFGEILNFYLNLPLMRTDDSVSVAVTHAGLFPRWTLNQAMAESAEISRVLGDPALRILLLRNMYADTPVCADGNGSGIRRWRFAFNAFTRMRFCDSRCNLNYGHSSASLQEGEAFGLYPWFKFTPPPLLNSLPFRLVFGHWAALKPAHPDSRIPSWAIALDTGCLWGGSLTCWCADTGTYTAVPSAGHL